MSKKVIVLATMDSKRGMGKNQGVPWNLPKEYEHIMKVSKTVKDKSKQNAVVMGKSTWLSIPEEYRPLPGQLNVVLSRSFSQSDLPDGVLLAKDLESAIALINSDKYDCIENIIMGGGRGVYEEAITKEFCDIIYLTKIQHDFGCDVFFPEFDVSVYEEVDDSKISKDVQEENDIKYTFHVYAKNS